MEDWIGKGEWIQAAEPKRDAVIVELIDGNFILHVECKNQANKALLMNTAGAIFREMHPPPINWWRVRDLPAPSPTSEGSAE